MVSATMSLTLDGIASVLIKFQYNNRSDTIASTTTSSPMVPLSSLLYRILFIPAISASIVDATNKDDSGGHDANSSVVPSNTISLYRAISINTARNRDKNAESFIESTVVYMNVSFSNARLTIHSIFLSEKFIPMNLYT